MKIISFLSFKGGAGKTTALMAASSGLLVQGRSVALLEADENRPLVVWGENAAARDTWDHSCKLHVADNLDSFETAFQSATASDVDFALVDTQGGGSALNEAILLNSSLVVIPSALTSLDIDAALETMTYAAETLQREQVDIPVAILLQRIPTGRLTVSQNSALKVLADLPQFTTRLHDRDAFASLKSRGLLHLTMQKLKADPLQRISATHFRTALAEAQAFATDITSEMEPEHVAAVGH